MRLEAFTSALTSYTVSFLPPSSLLSSFLNCPQLRVHICPTSCPVPCPFRRAACPFHLSPYLFHLDTCRFHLSPCLFHLAACRFHFSPCFSWPPVGFTLHSVSSGRMSVSPFTLFHLTTYRFHLLPRLFRLATCRFHLSLLFTCPFVCFT